MATEPFTTCLWFDTRAEEAARFYTSVFKDARMGSVSRYGEAGPYSGPGQHPGGDYEDEYAEAGDRFVPGFADESDDEQVRGRSGRGSRRVGTNAD